MSEEIRPVRPTVQPAMEKTSSSKTPWIILVVIVLLLVVFGALFRDKLFGAKSGVMGTKSAMTTTAYQAVFLTNGQVYFGKMSDISGDYATLKDIYYLQVVQPPLQGTPQAGQPNAAAGSATQQPQISLVKLGNELHGPVDEMHISRAQVLFYEDLKADGNVVKAIEAYKANPTGK